MKKILVWGASIRLFHWLLAIAFIASAYSGFQDKFDIWADVHLYAGVFILMLVCWRIVWGIVGSDTARFSQFVKGPKAVIAALKEKGPYTWVGHNPVGGVSVVVMLLLLLAQPIMGLYSSDDMFFSGPLADTVPSSVSNMMTSRHETVGYILIGIAVLHFLAVLYYRFIRKTDLVTPMITGKMDVEENTPEPNHKSGLMALVVYVVVAGGICIWIF